MFHEFSVLLGLRKLDTENQRKKIRLLQGRKPAFVPNLTQIASKQVKVASVAQRSAELVEFG